MTRRGLAAAAIVAAVAFMAVGRGTALAVDAPKWVAAIFVEAQRSVGLRWTPVPGATGYKVLRSEKSGAGYAEVAAPAVPQYFDTTVEAGSTYYYVLQAVAGAEVSPNSPEKSVLIPGQKKVALAAPEWRSVQTSSTTEFGKTSFKVALQWTKNAAVVAYNIYRSEVSGKDYQLINSVPEDQYVDSAVQEGKTYFYVLTGLDNSFQEGPFSAEKSVKLEAKKDEKKKEGLPNPKLLVKKSKESFKAAGGENYTLGVPADIAIDSDGNAYVIDVVEVKVKVFSPTGEFLRQFGEKGAETGKIMYPTGIGIDADDNIYVTDRATKARVVVFNSEGRFLREVVIPDPDAKFMEQFSLKTLTGLVRDVAVSKDGRIFAVDNSLHRLVIVSPDGKEFKTVGGPGSDPGQMNAPGWVAISPKKDEVHITDGLNRRVVVYDFDGNFLRFYGVSKTFIGSFVGATGIAFDAGGNSIVVDSAAATVQAFNPEGEYLWTLGDETGEIDKGSKQRSAWHYRSPSGVAFSPTTGDIVFSLNQDRALVARKVLD